MKRLIILLFCIALSLSLFSCKFVDEILGDEDADEDIGDSGDTATATDTDMEKLNSMISESEGTLRIPENTDASVDAIFDELNGINFSIEDIQLDGEEQDGAVIFKNNTLYVLGTGDSEQIIRICKYGILTISESDGQVASSMTPYSEMDTDFLQGIDIEELFDALEFKKGDLQKTGDEHIYTINNSYLLRVGKVLLDNPDFYVDTKTAPKITLDMTEYDNKKTVKLSIYDKSSEETSTVTVSTAESNGRKELLLSLSTESISFTARVISADGKLMELDVDGEETEDGVKTVFNLTCNFTDDNITTLIMDMESDSAALELKATVSPDGDVNELTANISASSENKKLFDTYITYDSSYISSIGESPITATVQLYGDDTSEYTIIAQVTTEEYSEESAKYSLTLEYSDGTESGVGSANMYCPAKSEPSVSKKIKLYLENGTKILEAYPAYLEKAESLNNQMQALLSSGDFGWLQSNYVTYDSATGIYYITSIAAVNGGYVSTTYSSPDAFKYAYVYRRNLGGFKKEASSLAERDAKALAPLIAKDTPDELLDTYGSFWTYTYIEDYDLYLMIEADDYSSFVILTSEPSEDMTYNGAKLHKLSYDEEGNVKIHTYEERVSDNCGLVYMCSHCGRSAYPGITIHDYIADVSEKDDEGNTLWRFTHCQRCKECIISIYNTGGSSVTVTLAEMSSSILSEIRNHKGFESYSLSTDDYTKVLVIDDISIDSLSTEASDRLEIIIPALSDYCDYTVIGVDEGANSLQSEVLASITLPDGIEFINEHAFAGIHFITKITLPSTVKLIGNSAFLNCSRLSEIVLNDGIVTIGEYAFYDCKALSSLYVPYGDKDASVGEFILPKTVSYIGNAAFLGTLVESVTIPQSITELSPQLFMDCKLLRSVSFEGDITVIPDYMFYGCELLTDITLPKSVLIIRDFAFYNCKSVTDALLYECNALESIGARAFYRCEGLKNVVVPSGAALADSAFYGCTFDSIRFDCTYSINPTDAGFSAKTVTYAGEITSTSIYFGEITNILVNELPESSDNHSVPSGCTVNFAGTEEEFVKAGYYAADETVTLNFNVDF